MNVATRCHLLPNDKATADRPSVANVAIRCPLKGAGNGGNGNGKHQRWAAMVPMVPVLGEGAYAERASAFALCGQSKTWKFKIELWRSLECSGSDRCRSSRVFRSDATVLSASRSAMRSSPRTISKASILSPVSDIRAPRFLLDFGGSHEDIY